MELYQSAYRTHYSTETALNIINDTLYKFLDSFHCAKLLLLELSSAFDTLNHNILIERIKELGIEGSSLNWLTSFLNDRTSSIKVNDYISPAIDILCEFFRDQYSDLYCYIFTCVLYLILLVNFIILHTIYMLMIYR